MDEDYHWQHEVHRSTMLPTNQRHLEMKLNDLVNHFGCEVMQIIPYPHKTTVREYRDKFFGKEWERYEEIPVDIITRKKVRGKYNYTPPQKPNLELLEDEKYILADSDDDEEE